MRVPLSEPDITELEIEAVVAVLRSSRLSLGPRMEEFEQRVASYVGVEHGIAVSSGTAGLHLCVQALDIGAEDEVIVPSFAFVAAANVIRYVGAVPVFVDIEASTLNMDPARIEAAITPRTRAIMAVHTFGYPAQIETIMDIARRHGLLVIEDACEAIGATCAGQRVGSFGDAAVFAFYPNKQITTGEGGMIVTRDSGLARTMRALRNQGRLPDDAWHQHALFGYNYRLSEINCALGCAQMQRLDEILQKRAAVAAMYRERLQDCDAILPPFQHALQTPAPLSGFGQSWFVFVVRIGSVGDGTLRDRAASVLAARGIQTGRYFAPIHEQPAYRDVPVTQPLHVTVSESRRTLALPFFSNMSKEQVRYVAEQLLDSVSSSTATR